MRPAAWPRAPELERLLVVDRDARTVTDEAIDSLASHFGKGDLLVVNDAATLPASLRGSVRGEPVELRIAAIEDDGFLVVAFGAGDWHTPTEHRPPPPVLAPGDVVCFDGLSATICAGDARSPRLYRVTFDRADAALWRALYHAGRPIQYAHVARPLPLWHTQTSYAGRPMAVELPSAGRPLRFAMMAALQRRGIAIAPLTHAAGLSATGDEALDARLPLPERYVLPASTVAAIASAARVIAVGTSVVRALEGVARLQEGMLRAGTGVTDLRIGAGFRPRIVHGLLTGVHAPGSSHHQLVSAFAPPVLLERALALAEARGYLGHEFGDSMLVAGR